MPLVALTSTLGRKRAAHLLRRACFGGSIAEIDAFASLTPAQAVQQLFDNTLPDPALPIDPLSGQEWINNPAVSEDDELPGYFLRWSIGQMLGSGVNDAQKLSYIFRERLVLFMHTHFTTKRSVVRDARALYYQQALFRLFAFDQDDFTLPPVPPATTSTTAAKNFKQLTKKISVDNAMLIFLDGRYNVKGSPNENYARELLELYSVGRGLEGANPEPEFAGDYYTFTEEDVQAGARVLSGFNIDLGFNNLDPETNLPRGVARPGSHEESTKTFSQRLSDGSVIPDPTLQLGNNPTENSMLDEVSQFVDLIYDQAETPVAICRELYRFFVYHQVSESLQNDIIQDMANVFVANDYKIQPVLESLLTSQHFYEADAGEDDNNFGCIIKSPLDLVVGYMRSFGIQVPDMATDTDMFYDLTGNILGQVDRQGMDYYEPFEVAGYAAYHQFPIFNRSWITTNYLTNRYNFIQGVITADQMDMEMDQVYILQFVQDNFPLSTIRIADDFIITVAEYFLPVAENLSFTTTGGELTSERLNFFKTSLFSFEIDADPEGSWTFRWDGGIDPETRANQLKDLFNAMLQSPEYQLM